LRAIEYAKSLGGWLLVLINSDASIKAIKGEGRPFIPENDRARLLAALRAVDGVMIFRGRTPCEVLGQLKPAIHVKGGDWKAEDLPETKIVEAAGGRVVILPRDEGPSTSEIAERVRK
jgi:glycerol-3-phosphate cytidylyltransferase